MKPYDPYDKNVRTKLRHIPVHGLILMKNTDEEEAEMVARTQVAPHPGTWVDTDER